MSILQEDKQKASKLAHVYLQQEQLKFMKENPQIIEEAKETMRKSPTVYQNNADRAAENRSSGWTLLLVGGKGLIIVEASCVAEDGKLRDNQIGIGDDSFIDGLSKVADIGKKYDVPMLIQIHHAGFKDDVARVSEEVLDKILDQFVEAFKRAKKAGFDGIEIHGAHTYLISQLNSRLWKIG